MRPAMLKLSQSSERAWWSMRGWPTGMLLASGWRTHRSLTVCLTALTLVERCSTERRAV